MICMYLLCVTTYFFSKICQIFQLQKRTHFFICIFSLTKLLFNYRRKHFSFYIFFFEYLSCSSITEENTFLFISFFSIEYLSWFFHYRREYISFYIFFILYLGCFRISWKAPTDQNIPSKMFEAIPLAWRQLEHVFSPHFIVWSSFHFMWSVFEVHKSFHTSWGGLAERTPEIASEILILKAKCFQCLKRACQLYVKRGEATNEQNDILPVRWAQVIYPHTNCPEIVDPKSCENV